MRRIVPVVLGCVVVSGCSSKSDANRHLEAVGSQRQAIDVLTNELRGQVDFTNAPGGAVATALATVGMTGGSIGANSQGSPPSPPVSASTSLTDVSADRLSADYQLTVAAGNASLAPPET